MSLVAGDLGTSPPLYNYIVRHPNPLAHDRINGLSTRLDMVSLALYAGLIIAGSPDLISFPRAILDFNKCRINGAATSDRDIINQAILDRLGKASF
jgi:hypothetical protein